MALFSNLLWLPASALCFLLLLLVIPRGVFSGRWRVWVVLAIGGTVLGMVQVGLTPGELYGYSSPANPFRIPGMPSLLDAVGLVGVLLLALSLVASIVSLILRFRRSRGTERQQIKWLLYDAVLVGLVVPAFVLYEGECYSGCILPVLLSIVLVIVVASMPVAVGIAILKYRLYDIDVVINRTLVYGPLTATLAALYFGAIVVLQRVFVVLTGQQSTLAVVASSLVTAALFIPLRRRIQSFIDKRFYRRKYDAAKTLEAFSARLRDETDLDALSDDLVGVMRETMAPAHASLWLSPDTSVKGSSAGSSLR